jgi:hypothetical protein
MEDAQAGLAETEKIHLLDQAQKEGIEMCDSVI